MYFVSNGAASANRIIGSSAEGFYDSLTRALQVFDQDVASNVSVGNEEADFFCTNTALDMTSHVPQVVISTAQANFLDTPAIHISRSADPVDLQLLPAALLTQASDVTLTPSIFSASTSAIITPATNIAAPSSTVTTDYFTIACKSANNS